ncbi:hypothetical protein [Sphingomonas sp. UNC305MFCol5.2]|uniref:hypothetical protein n=1 Tax=Sphingomonas sp. UNC305MFCol5.2 TaxID=1449076 RepID=UPI0012DF16A7|nr:hypothetical protein [Sphingomonas sp. UNC305MFCol5.2]
MGTEDDKTKGQASNVPAVTEIKLSKDEVNEITAHINRKARDPNDGCPVCGSPLSYVLENTYRVEVLTNIPAFGGTYQPLTATTCEECGFVRFFNLNIVKARIADAETDGSDGG